MRWVLLLVALPACASRSTLHADKSDAAEPDVIVDTPEETWSRETGGATCSERPAICPMDDWGPIRAVAAIYEKCGAETGAACGDLRLSFDAEGCVVLIDEISRYSPAFVECVAREASATRWQCAKGGAAYHMFQSCDL